MIGIDKTNYNKKAILLAVIAAVLYGISAPVSKLLLTRIPPTLMASLLYLGAGFGMLVLNSYKSVRHKGIIEAKITSKELPYVAGMILLDIAAPILLMFGLTMTTSENAALLNNFEIVATSLIAMLIFKEAVGKRMWLSIVLITISSIVLTIKDFNGFTFSTGSVFVLMACICWGLENNCTRKLSMKDPKQIVVVKGFGSGTVSLIISLIAGQYSNNIMFILLTMLLGFVAYGLSIFFYIHAQRELGAARSSIYYSAAPFIGVFVSWIVFRDGLKVNFLFALVIMLIGTYFAVSELHKHMHVHEIVSHEHMHNHMDRHHTHTHVDGFTGEHSHPHTHEEVIHNHAHTPDLHHDHNHNKLNES